jgi:threonine/homoserine/homoserine lactone efflux protein
VSDPRGTIPHVTPEFWITTLVVVATPGTGALYTLGTALSRGWRAAVVAAVGCTLGTIPHAVAAVTGLAALLHASGVAFAAIKYAGVAYLLWMAWQTWRDTGALALPSGDEPAHRLPVRTLLTSGVTLNLLNPKLTLFFFAFLPQFVPAGTPGAVGHMLGLSAVFMVVTFVVFAAYGVAAGAVRHQVASRPRAITWVRRSFAVGFAAMAGRLAVAER